MRRFIISRTDHIWDLGPIDQEYIVFGLGIMITTKIVIIIPKSERHDQLVNFKQGLHMIYLQNTLTTCQK